MHVRLRRTAGRGSEVRSVIHVGDLLGAGTRLRRRRKQRMVPPPCIHLADETRVVTCSLANKSSKHAYMYAQINNNETNIKVNQMQTHAHKQKLNQATQAHRLT